LNVPALVREWLHEQGYGEVVSSRGAAGGCISQGAQLKTSSGESFFLKQNHSAPPDMFAREAEGLAALKVAGGPRVPEPLLVGESVLLLEDLQPGAPRADYWDDFGRQMAALHNFEGSHFGFQNDNYIGSTPQPNGWMEDGFQFFAERRLNYQAELARRKRLLSASDAAQVERLAARLPELIPAQPASLIHGDLWSGNAIGDSQGRPAIIDPAAYYGWGEADLAMTALFGAFPDRFYQSYRDVRPLPEGFRRRFDVYNLYHLLNHLNLFGLCYLEQVKGILRRYP
jgi:protein-ribulosamine 3-kinase